MAKDPWQSLVEAVDICWETLCDLRYFGIQSLHTGAEEEMDLCDNAEVEADCIIAYILSNWDEVAAAAITWMDETDDVEYEAE